MFALLLTGASVGAAAHAVLSQHAGPARAQEVKPAPDVNGLAAEIEAIKGKLPDQAHAMQDVGYHFSNLWFAGQHEHWDLADFYWAETRSHLRWAVRIIPKRKDNAGQEIDLAAILEGMENGPLNQLHEAIAARDKAGFVKAYRFSTAACSRCHKASAKPFIRPQIPAQPETPIINFDPKAEWPR
ncbi:MAG: hypothetical protein WD229_01785 [Pirellulales bacterium]